MTFLSAVAKSKIQTSFANKKLVIEEELRNRKKGASWSLLFIFAAFCPTERTCAQPFLQSLNKLDPPLYYAVGQTITLLLWFS